MSPSSWRQRRRSPSGGFFQASRGGFFDFWLLQLRWVDFGPGQDGCNCVGTGCLDVRRRRSPQIVVEPVGRAPSTFGVGVGSLECHHRRSGPPKSPRLPRTMGPSGDFVAVLRLNRQCKRRTGFKGHLARFWRRFGIYDASPIRAVGSCAVTVGWRLRRRAGQALSQQSRRLVVGALREGGPVVLGEFGGNGPDPGRW